MPSEKDLCQQFSAGRTSVREAVRSLCIAGILDARAGECTCVSAGLHRHLERALQWSMLLDQLDERVVANLIEARLMLESHTAYLAAGKATADDLFALGEF